MYKRILVPLDGSSQDMVALHHATSFAKTANTEIALVRAMILPLYTFVIDEPIVTMDFLDVLEQEAHVALARVRRKMTNQGLKVLLAEVVSSPVTEKLLDISERINADVILLTSENLRTWRFLFGEWQSRAKCRKMPNVLICSAS